MREYLSLSVKTFFTGFLMFIPGVSGGTAAIAFGIYEKLLDYTGRLFRLKAKEYALFLIAAMSGVLGLFIAALVLKPVLEGCGAIVRTFFCGAVGAMGLFFLMSRKPDVLRIKHILCLLSGLAVPFLLMLIPSADVQAGFLLAFISGVPIAAAFILPGVSTSHMLVILGMYDDVLDAVSEGDIVFFIPIALGCLIGCLIFARLFSALDKKHPSCIAFAITGFVLSGIGQLYPFELAPLPPWQSVLLILLGIGAVVACDFGMKKRVSREKEKKF